MIHDVAGPFRERGVFDSDFLTIPRSRSRTLSRQGRGEASPARPSFFAEGRG